MKRIALHLILLAGLGAGLARSLAPGSALAAAAASFTLGDPVDSRVSGYSGYVGNAGPSNDPGRAVYGITWSEFGDDPCKLEAHTHHLNNNSTSTDKTHSGPDLCNAVSGGNTKEVILPGRDNYIYKVQVCTTDKSDTSRNKLKGVRLWSRTVNNDGRLLTTNSTYQEAKHTNCNKWHEKVECPSGAITSRLKLHYNDQRDFTGIQLVCREVQRSS